MLCIQLLSQHCKLMQEDHGFEVSLEKKKTNTQPFSKLKHKRESMHKVCAEAWLNLIPDWPRHPASLLPLLAQLGF